MSQDKALDNYKIPTVHIAKVDAMSEARAGSFHRRMFVYQVSPRVFLVRSDIHPESGDLIATFRHGALV